MSQKQLMQDSIDHRDYPIEEGVIIDSLDIRLQEIIKKQHPDIASGAFISYKNLTYYRLLFL